MCQFGTGKWGRAAVCVEGCARRGAQCHPAHKIQSSLSEVMTGAFEVKRKNMRRFISKTCLVSPGALRRAQTDCRETRTQKKDEHG